MADILDVLRGVSLKLLVDKPFFGFLISKMQIIEDKDSRLGSIRTAATDGKNIYYNKEFILSMKQKEVLFVFTHEVMHCVLNSFGRLGGRDKQYWNMATDYVINDILITEKIGTMPGMGLHNPKYHGWTAEAVYDDLVKNKSAKEDTLDVHIDMDGMSGQESKKGNGSSDASRDGDDGDEAGSVFSRAELEENAKEFRKMVIESYQRSKMIGKELGSIEKMVGELISPRINWRQLLDTTIQSIFKADITWTRPNRRSISNIILPATGFQDTVDICVSIDTSGSISDKQRIEFLSEIAGILEYYQSFKLKIWCFDTGIHNFAEYDHNNIKDLVSYVPGGGGGTDIGCNFTFMKEKQIVPKQFVVLTDGYNCSDYWGDPNYCNTIWLIHSNSNPQVPFGNWAQFEDLVGERR